MQVLFLVVSTLPTLSHLMQPIWLKRVNRQTDTGKMRIFAHDASMVSDVRTMSGRSKNSNLNRKSVW
jgi:hypothetical protein